MKGRKTNAMPALARFKPEYDFGATGNGKRASIPYAFYAAVWELGRERYKGNWTVPLKWDERPQAFGLDQCLCDLLRVNALAEWWKRGHSKSQWLSFAETHRALGDENWSIPCLSNVMHDLDPVADARAFTKRELTDPIRELPYQGLKISHSVEFHKPCDGAHTDSRDPLDWQVSTLNVEQLRRDPQTTATKISDLVRGKIRSLVLRQASILGLIPGWRFDVEPETILKHLAAARLDQAGFTWRQIVQSRIWCSSTSNSNWRKYVRGGTDLLDRTRQSGSLEVSEGDALGGGGGITLPSRLLTFGVRGDLPTVTTGLLQFRKPRS